MIRHTFITIAILALAASPAAADKLFMKNGSVIIGKLISAEDNTVVFETPFAGQISIKEENIRRISTDEPVTIMLTDGTVHADRQIVSTEEAMLVKKESGEAVVFKSTDIDMVNPEPWKLGEGYDWSGRFDLAIELERGNGDTDELDLDFESVWMSLRDRYTLEGDHEYESSNGVRRDNNWSLLTKYDRFFKGHGFYKTGHINYWGAKAFFEFDEFNDLDLRTTVGPYLGRQFFNTSRLTLRAEFGPVYADEQFDRAEDDSWFGASWIVKATSDILGFGTTTYFNHDGTQNLEEVSDLILNSTIGVRFPIYRGFDFSIEAEYEYDGGAVEGIENLDETYNFKLGYGW